MGEYDSSKTRVEPIFKAITDKYPDGSWLTRLLALPVCERSVSLPGECGSLIGPLAYGKSERKLSPPLSLLSWLIRHPELLSKQVEQSASEKTKRQLLLDGDRDTMIEALSLLDGGSPKEEGTWYILEGKTQPDVFIETANLIIVIEGKRTEPGPTRHTTWMPVRHQMLRHLDCAWEIRGQKQLVGFFVVEGEMGGEAVPARWDAFARETIIDEVIQASLPHRGPAEQKGIADSFVGVTTWQRICREFGMDVKTFCDEVPQKRAVVGGVQAWSVSGGQDRVD